MERFKPNPQCSYRIEDPGDENLSVRLTGILSIDTVSSLLKEITPRIQNSARRAVTLDLSEISYMDDFGAVAVHQIKKIMGPNIASFRIMPPAGQNGGDLLNHPVFRPKSKILADKKHRFYALVVRLGETTIEEAKQLRFLLFFIGSIVMAMLKVFVKPRSLRVGDTIDHMEKTGVDALPIVALISFLLGLIMAFMASIQFRQFGAGIYVASLVALAMVSELGPIMTAIVVAGRSGSAYAAEIGAMKISEEIDALTVMGFDVTLFLAIPRLIASAIVVPILTLFSDLFAVAGGLLVGVTMLDLSANMYIRQTLESLRLTEVIWGMGKSAVFAVLISLIGCLQGFQAKGGATAVGDAATSAVVRSIFFIILFDSLFAVIRSYWR